MEKLYTIRRGKQSLSVSNLGAELRHLDLGKGERLWQRDPAFWGRSAPWLFPFVGRLKEGRYLFEGQSYTMPTHGFLRDSFFTLAEQTAERLSFCLRDSAASRRLYPFAFALQVVYELYDNGVEINITVSNTGQQKLYYALGGHPAFKLLPGASSEAHAPQAQLSDYRLYFPSLRLEAGLGSLFAPSSGQASAAERDRLARARFDEAGLFLDWEARVNLTKAELALNAELLANDAVFLKGQGSSVILRSQQSADAFAFGFPDYPYLGIWQPARADCPFLSLEPWTAMPGRADRVEELSQKSDLKTLAAGASDIYCCCMEELS